jgi:hypothetical protein
MNVHRPFWPNQASALAVMASMVAGCGDGPTGLVEQAAMEIVFHDLRPLDAADGSLEVWLVAGPDTVSAGRVSFPGGHNEPGEVVHGFSLPLTEPERAFVTVEPPMDSDPGPSAFVMLEGSFEKGTAGLAIMGVVTDGRLLETDPGAHSLFTTSNNVNNEGRLEYPSLEDAGLWLFTLRPGKNKHGTREVKVTPLRAAWTYEGWAVFHYGRPDEVWVSYGKFRPDLLSLLSSRDDTGSGPYSGDEDYLNAGVEDVPGEEWTTDNIAVQIGVSLPPGVSVPFDLDAEDPVTLEAEWTHVITIEPAFDEGEPMFQGNPLVIQTYRNPIGVGGEGCREIQPHACPGDPRVILYEEEPPTATVRLAVG